jgi:PAS domain S-box-containing protein
MRFMASDGNLSLNGTEALSQQVLQAINRINEESLVCTTDKDLRMLCLCVAEELTQSTFGFLGLIDPERPLFDMVIRDQRTQDALRMDAQTGCHLLPIDAWIDGICAPALRDGKGFFTNDFARHSACLGLPQEHPPISTFLCVPLVYDHKIIGTLGMGNRNGGYRNNDLFMLNALSVTMAVAIKRQQAEDALRESENLFRALFESFSVAMAIAQPETGRLLAVNETYQKMLGYSLADLEHRTFRELTHPEDREADWEGFSRMVRGESSSYSIVKRLLHKDGSTVWCLVSVNLVRDAAGRPMRFVAVIHDISGHKQMEHELHIAHQQAACQEKFLSAVFEALPVGICITDAQGGVIRTNHMDEKIWQKRPGTNGVDDYDKYKAWWANTGRLVQPDEWASAQAIQKGQTVLNQILEIEGFDGKHRFVNNSAAPVFDNDGKIIGSAVSIQDVTQQWEYYGQLTEAKIAAEEANRAKSDFLSTMSHEIRTPMTVLLSTIEHLIHIDQNPEHRELLSLAEQAYQQLNTLVSDILDFSRIEARKMELHEEIFDLRKCLYEAVNFLSPKALEKRLSLELELSPTIPEKIVGDQHRLGQVLINLIGNAIKFTDAGMVKVAVQNRDGTLEFSVSDTGIGISEDNLDKIFEVFTQVDISATRRHGGSGLGLAIAKELVQLMGGRIGVRSRSGQGSIFTFTLPFKGIGDRNPANEGEAQAAKDCEAHILLAEDDPMVREVILTTLSRRPWRIMTAETGKDAIQKWQSDSFDLILMDIQMPEMSGLEATREIRGMEAGTGKRIGIIGLTAHVGPDARRQCLDVGMDDVLNKPFKTSDLFMAIERCLMG